MCKFRLIILLQQENSIRYVRLLPLQLPVHAIKVHIHKYATNLQRNYGLKSAQVHCFVNTEICYSGLSVTVNWRNKLFCHTGHFEWVIGMKLPLLWPFRPLPSPFQYKCSQWCFVIRLVRILEPSSPHYAQFRLPAQTICRVRAKTARNLELKRARNVRRRK